MKTARSLATGLVTTMLMVGLAAGPACAGQAGASHRVTGSVVAVDRSAQTFTLRDAKGRTYTLKAGTRTAAQLPVLREGERIKVVYETSDGELVATAISAA
jgi:Cu/Ag efflux protein CusF